MDITGSIKNVKYSRIGKLRKCKIRTNQVKLVHTRCSSNIKCLNLHSPPMHQSTSLVIPLCGFQVQKIVTLGHPLDKIIYHITTLLNPHLCTPLNRPAEKYLQPKDTCTSEDVL